MLTASGIGGLIVVRIGVVIGIATHETWPLTITTHETWPLTITTHETWPLTIVLVLLSGGLGLSTASIELAIHHSASRRLSRRPRARPAPSAVSFAALRRDRHPTLS